MNNNPWIDAFTDSRASVNTFSTCMTLADIAGDKDNRLVIADFGEGYSYVKLKVYKGTQLDSEIPFSDIPCAITSIYTDFNVPHIPGLAVASGNQVYLYKNLRPFFKFCLPNDEENVLESEIWKEREDIDHLTKLLENLKIEIGFSNLSTLSQKFLMLKDEEKNHFLESHKVLELKKQTVITCMTSLHKSMADNKSISCLVLATESCKVFILDPEAFTVLKQFKCPDVGIHIVATGVYAVDYNIVLSCRNGSVCVIKSNETKVLTELSAYSVGLVQLSDCFVVACMDSTLQAFNLKGKKQWTANLIGQPLCMTLVPLQFLSITMVAVSLQVYRNESKAGVVLFYSGPHILHSISYSEPISAILFGQYGLEEHALITISTLGKFSVKLLRRNAQFDVEDKSLEFFYNQPHQIQLMVPKKSKIFIEQTLRERNEFKTVHGIFQKSWLQLNIDSSEKYLDALMKSSVSKQDALKLNHQVLGLGPNLKLQLLIQNTSKDKILSNLGITFIFDPTVYNIQRKCFQVDRLVPGLELCLESDIICLSSISSQVTIIIFSANRVILSNVINMPMATSIEEQ